MADQSEISFLIDFCDNKVRQPDSYNYSLHCSAITFWHFSIGFGPIVARMLHQSSRHKHGTFAAALMPEKLAEMSCRL